MSLAFFFCRVPKFRAFPIAGMLACTLLCCFWMPDMCQNRRFSALLDKLQVKPSLIDAHSKDPILFCQVIVECPSLSKPSFSAVYEGGRRRKRYIFGRLRSPVTPPPPSLLPLTATADDERTDGGGGKGRGAEEEEDL